MLIFKPILKYPFCNLYKRLGVKPEATHAEIKRNYFQLAKKLHPDTGPITSQEFVKIQNAYETLKNPHLRKLYDQEHFPDKHSTLNEKHFHYYTTGENVQDPAKKWAEGLRFYARLTILALFFYGLSTFIKPMTEHQIRRQNILLAKENIDDGPAVQEKRRLKYAQQMKDKKVSARVVHLKVRDGSQQSTKAKNNRKNSIESITGVTKEKDQIQQTHDRQKYM